MGETQTNIASFEEAEKMEKAASKYFKPYTNTKYELTFKRHPEDARGYKLVQKEIPDFNNKAIMNKKIALEIIIDSENGEKVEKEWSILSPFVREQFSIPCTSGNLFKKVYLVAIKGEGKEKKYTVSELRDR